jgi:hypothetical protein
VPSALRQISVVGRFIPGYPSNIVILCTASTVVLLAALLLAAPVSSAAPAAGLGSKAPDADRFELREGVVVDRGESRLFLMAPDGALEAVDLSTGESEWRSTEAALPLVLGRPGLLAMAESATPGRGLELVALDPASGEVRSRGRFELPALVSARIDDALGLSFRLQATGPAGQGSEDGVLDWGTLDWEYSQERVSGMPLPEKEASKGSLDLAGRLSVAAPGSAPSSANSATDALRIRALAVDEKADAQPAIELWGDQQLKVSEGEGARQFLSIDGAHVLVATRIERSDSTDSGQPTPKQLMMERYRWTLYERSGARLGSASSPVAYAPFFVTEGRVVHEVRPMGWVEGEKKVENGLRLRAVDLGSGVEMWTRDLRDTAYRGPFPP